MKEHIYTTPLPARTEGEAARRRRDFKSAQFIGNLRQTWATMTGGPMEVHGMAEEVAAIAVDQGVLGTAKLATGAGVAEGLVGTLTDGGRDLRHKIATVPDSRKEQVQPQIPDRRRERDMREGGPIRLPDTPQVYDLRHQIGSPQLEDPRRRQHVIAGQSPDDYRSRM